MTKDQRQAILLDAVLVAVAVVALCFDVFAWKGDGDAS